MVIDFHNWRRKRPGHGIGEIYCHPPPLPPTHTHTHTPQCGQKWSSCYHWQVVAGSEEQESLQDSQGGHLCCCKQFSFSISYPRSQALPTRKHTAFLYCKWWKVGRGLGTRLVHPWSIRNHQFVGCEGGMSRGVAGDWAITRLQWNANSFIMWSSKAI